MKGKALCKQPWPSKPVPRQRAWLEGPAFPMLPGWGTMLAFCTFDLGAWPCCPSVPEQEAPHCARAGALGDPERLQLPSQVIYAPWSCPSHPALWSGDWAGREGWEEGSCRKIINQGSQRAFPPSSGEEASPLWVRGDNDMTGQDTSKHGRTGCRYLELGELNVQCD